MVNIKKLCTAQISIIANTCIVLLCVLLIHLKNPTADTSCLTSHKLKNMSLPEKYVVFILLAKASVRLLVI